MTSAQSIIESTNLLQDHPLPTKPYLLLATPPAVKQNGSPRPDQPHEANHIFRGGSRMELQQPSRLGTGNREPPPKLKTPQPLAAVRSHLRNLSGSFQLQSETRSTHTKLQETGQRFAVRRLGVACLASRANHTGLRGRAGSRWSAGLRATGLLELATREAGGKTRLLSWAVVWCAEWCAPL